MLTTSTSLVSLSIAFGVSQVLATGGFPPINGPPGACGLEPADASCTAVFSACVDSTPSEANPLNSDACVAAASCYPGSVDSFLANVFCRIHGPTGNPPRSVNISRISDDVYSRIAQRGQTVTLESYTQWYTQQATTAHPGVANIIDRAFVKESFDIIAAWTGFCSTANIPKSNFLDWFQYSSTVTGPATTCHTVDNCPKTFVPYCMDLAVTCAHNENVLDNPFSFNSCAAGAFCWQDGVNSFLQAITCRNNIEYDRNRAAPVGTSVPAMTPEVIPTSPFTQQNFIDFIYGQLSAVGGDVRFPSPDSTPVVDRWSIIVAWTNFCTTRAVPRANLSDFLRYSAVALTSTTCSTPQPPQCTPDPNPSCEQLFQSCVASPNILTDPYSNLNCALAASCRQGGVIAFGNAIACAKNTQGNSANPRFYPRLSTSVFNSLSFGDTTISQQNYIDSYYGALSQISNPAWPDVSYVIGKWDIVKTWTAFPSGEVPYQNFADFLQYS